MEILLLNNFNSYFIISIYIQEVKMLTQLKSNYIDSRSASAIFDFSNLVFNFILKNNKSKNGIIILCIGTDRSTGDSLGPLVGYKLAPYISNYPNVHLLGTLEEPVHAKNLDDKINYIKSAYNESLILAIDASLGNMDKIGYISIRNGPIKPGLGVNKDLPEIGDISITGVVNVGGMMEYLVLQNTRLSLVMNMADVIARSINIALFRLKSRIIKEGIKYI